MHREILGLSHGDPRMGEHENRDTLDNTDDNLRIATRRQNNCNQKMRRDNTVGLKGVSRNGKGFAATIRVNGKAIHLGTRSTPDAAAQLYAQAATLYHGEFARFS